MKVNFSSSRTKLTLAAFFAVLATITLVFVIVDHSSPFHKSQTQEQKDSVTKLFGPDGKNVQQASATVDMMHKSFKDRLNEVEAQCDKKKVSDAERSRLIMATYAASKTAIDKVEASKYQAPFEPHYPSLPQ